jgi:hypothetical protein
MGARQSQRLHGLANFVGMMLSQPGPGVTIDAWTIMLLIDEWIIARWTAVWTIAI